MSSSNDVFNLSHGLALLALLASGCGDAASKTSPSGAAASTASASAPATSADAAASASATTSASATAADAAPQSWPGSADGCRDGMVRVDGEYCPAVAENCKKHHKEFETAKGDAKKTASERCIAYEKPTRCLSKKKQHLSFCMDRFEYPNVVGEIPRVLTSWHQAKKRCEEQGKRLCTEAEYNFACEGPEALPYVYGYERDPQTCAIDKPYRYPDHSKQMHTYDECLTDEWCKAELGRLDQREPIGQRKTCVSWAGLFDLNGNVNEWVEIPKEKPPNRSGLKGGWWGPVRGRCRPTVTFHKESDYGYEVGFRCCEDAKSAAK